MKNREQILAEAERILGEIEKIFADAEHWNEEVRQAHEAKINPDPDGQLARSKAQLQGMMGQVKKAPTLDWERAHQRVQEFKAGTYWLGLRHRYANGERTLKLYNEIMQRTTRHRS